MKKTIAVFVIGTLISLVTVGGGVLTFRKFFVSADPSYEPKNIEIARISPTAGEVTFETDKETIASMECSDKKEGPFTLCGSETQKTNQHQLKTAIILDPDKKYFFQLKINGRKFDNLGLPFVLENKETQQSGDFPSELFGTCEEDADFDAVFDTNKDGCIRQNDRDLLTY